MSHLPRDISRCTASKCPDREGCLRYTDVPRTGVLSFFDPSEKWTLPLDPTSECLYKIAP